MSPNNPNQPPFMKWYEADFQLSTQGWPEFAKLIYRALLQIGWHRPSLPRSEPPLAMLCGVELSTFRKYWKPYIKEKFINVKGGGIQNPRIIRDRNAVKLAGLNSKKYGKVGGDKSAAKRKADAAAARAQDRKDIHARARDGEPLPMAGLDPSTVIGRQ